MIGLRRLAGRLALCLAGSWLGWRTGHGNGLALSLALYAALLPRPLLELASDLRHGLRRAVWAPVEGRYFVYRGTPVQVIADAQHRRWVRAADIRRIVGFTTRDSALVLTYPDGYREMGQPPEPHFSDESLLLHLARQPSAEASRLRRWVERDIAFPARRLRERRRDRDGPPAAHFELSKP